MNLKLFTAAATLPFIASLAHAGMGADVVTNSYSQTVNATVPLGGSLGTSTITISGVAGTVVNVSVQLDITGGFNGDLYVTLAGPAGGFSVLLNRVGLSSSNQFGYSDSGVNITLDDAADNNIHYYQTVTYSLSGGQLTGSWQPDGRNIDPQSDGSAFDAASSTAPLGSFDGNTADGDWTLSFGDFSSGSGQGTVVNWGMTVVTVPEPQMWVLFAGGIGTLLVLNYRRKL